MFGLRVSLKPLLLTLFVFTLLSLTFTGFVTATASDPSPVNIHINRRVQIQNGGSVVINDTVSLSTNSEESSLPQNFSLGFPLKYGSNLDYCFAYNASSIDERLGLALDVGLGKFGFYGVNVELPPVNISEGGSYNFTVTFVFSNLVSLTGGYYHLDFPLYPSLAEEASACNVTVALPSGAEYVNSSYGSIQILNHTKSSLESFTETPAWLNFDAPASFLLINVHEIRREVTLDETGHVHLSDSYRITNRAENALSTIQVNLPRGAYDVSAIDAMGSLSVSSKEGNATTYTNATVNPRIPLETGEEVEFMVAYRLPRENYVNQLGWWDFNLTLSLFERFEWTIKKLTVTVTLPQGAEFGDYSPVKPSAVQKGAFQEKVTFTIYNVTHFQDLRFSITYRHLVFWASFRPTLLTGALAIAACAVALLRRAPKPTAPVIPIPSDVLRGFVDAYEDRRKVLSELESVERQAQKRRISRRRYKVRRRTLDGRISTLSRDLTSLRERMRRAGGTYADMVERIEVAETQLEEVKAGIQRIEARYRRREISSEAHRRLLEEYHRRRDSAENAIEGLLLRLREEIR